MEVYLRQNLNDNNIRIEPFTTAVVATYLDAMMIQAHCDQRWSADGKFIESQNSQVKDTATVVLVIGESRSLDFEMYRYNGKEQVQVGVKGRFQLEHGSLFILHPKDEEPKKRKNFERYGRTFYKHSSNGVEGRELEMSIGIVFRSTNHLVEVNRKTGLVVLDEKLEMNKIVGKKEVEKKKKSTEDVDKEREVFSERNEMLEYYMAGKVHPKNKKAGKNQRKKNESKIKRAWKNCKKTYFPIIRRAERKYIGIMCLDVGAGIGWSQEAYMTRGMTRRNGIVIDHEGVARNKKRKGRVKKWRG